MGLSFYDFTTERENFFWAFDSSSVCGTMMRALMKNEGFKQQFILRYYDVVNNHMTPEYLNAIFEEMYAERDPLMTLQAGRWPEGGERGTFTVSKWQNECTRIRNFIDNRQPYALSHFYQHFGISEDDLEHLAQKRVTVSFHSGRTDVTINGETVENGTVIRLEQGETKTLNIVATAKEGYVVTSITFMDKEGNAHTVEGNRLVLKTGQPGTVSISSQRIVANPDAFKNATITAGATYLFYLTGDGDLYAWGDNRYGVLGIGSTPTVVDVPTYVMSGVAKVVTSAGNAYENGDTTFATAILTTDGRLFTVGRNTCGQLGRNGSADDANLGLVELDFKVKDVSMGHDHLLIVDEKGNLWGIGSNSYGALGTTNVGGNVSSFVKLDTNVAFASAGRRSTVYVKNDGTLWGIGDNRWKKISQSHGDQIHTPIQMASNIEFVDSGEHQILVVDHTGKLYYAGWRSVAGFGQGGGNNPTLASLMSGGVKKADSYFGNVVALSEDGKAYVYGLNTENGIGNNAYTDGAPRQIMEGVQDVAAGYGFTAYLMEDGTLLIQGNNSYGQAGNGTTGGTVHMSEIDLPQ
jgi:alpha-tubulin suppressor-like RCC1 family protein